MAWLFQKGNPAQRGFTLVELMIVIAIIGILSVVLVPKIGRAKDAAKIAGVEANMRAVMREITLMIDDYTDAEAFETAVVQRLDNMLTNPYNDSRRAYKYLPSPTPYDQVAVRTHWVKTQNLAKQDWHFSLPKSIATRSDCKGAVMVGVGDIGGVLEGVGIYGFNGKGDPITYADKALKVMK